LPPAWKPPTLKVSVQDTTSTTEVPRVARAALPAEILGAVAFGSGAGVRALRMVGDLAVD
jgi:hypothetical protein